MSAETVLIVGAGTAGRSLALSLRRADFAGDIVLVSDEPEVPYDRPPLSKSVVVGEVDAAGVTRPDRAAYAQDRVDLRLGVAVTAIAAAARTAQLSDGSTITWTALVLATGAAPRQLPIAGLDQPGVHRVTRLDEALALRDALVGGPKHLVIIGGGFIGMEVAAAAVKHGHRATVLEAAPEPLSRPLGLEVAERVLAWSRARGVEIRVGTAVEQVLGDGQPTGVRTAAGEELAADVVVAAIGVAPRLDLARALGCAEAAGGIAVDAGLRTSIPDVYAIGDIAAYPSSYADEPLIRVEHVSVAIGHGQVAATQIARGEGAYDDLPTFWSDQGDVTLNVVGAPRAEDTIVWRGDVDAPVCTAFYLRAGRLRAALAANDTRTLRAARRLITAGVSPTPEQLADPTVALIELLPG